MLFVAEGLRRAGDECVNVVDNLADVVGYSSGRIRGVGTALKGDDFKFGPSSTRLRCRAHARRIATDDNKSLLNHGALASIGDDDLGDVHSSHYHVQRRTRCLCRAMMPSIGALHQRFHEQAAALTLQPSPISIALFCPGLGPPQEVLAGGDGRREVVDTVEDRRLDGQG